MTTAGDMAVNEARALRLVLASITAGYDSGGSIQLSQKVFDEIDCVECMETVVSVLANLLAEDLIIAKGEKKATRELEKKIAWLLDWATGKVQKK